MSSCILYQLLNNHFHTHKQDYNILLSLFLYFFLFEKIMNLINNNLINGCANITGGGLSDNIKRIIPDKLTAHISLDKIKTYKIFNWLKNNGISDKEMLKTFNCGVGFCLIVESKNLKKISKFFSKEYKPYVIGRILNGKTKVKLNDSINWYQ